jgi:hypothetical protein
MPEVPQEAVWAGALEVASPYPEEMTTRMRHAVIWSR